MNVGSIIWVSIQAVIRLLLIVVIGSIFAYKGLFLNDARQVLSKMSTIVFVPCLVFTNIAGGLDFEMLKSSWVLLLIPVVFGFVGVVVAYALCTVLRIKNAGTRKVIIFAFMFANYGTLPIGIIEAVTEDVPPFSKDPKSKEIGFAKVALIISVASIALWTLGPWYMKFRTKKDVDPSNETELESLNKENEILNDIDSSSEDDDNDIDQLSIPLDEDESYINTKKCLRCRSWFGMLKKKLSWINSKKVKEIINPTVLASATAILLIFAKPIKNLLFESKGQEPPLGFISKTIGSLANLTVPVALLLLGANLLDSYMSRRKKMKDINDARERGDHLESSNMLGMKTIFTIIFTRLLILPSILFGLSILLRLAGIIDSDPITGLVVFVDAVSPSAINLIIIAQLHQDSESIETLSTILLYQYIFCAIPIVISVCLSLYILI